MKYAVEMGSGPLIYNKFHMDWFSLSKVDKGGYTAHRQYGDRISLRSFFQSKDGRLKVGHDLYFRIVPSSFIIIL
jgi:hypothetical protein